MNSQRTLSYTAETLNNFLCRLYVRGAVKINTKEGFRLHLHQTNPDAPNSPLYFNLRVPSNKGGPLTESDVQEMAGFFYAYLTGHNVAFDAIAPVPNAGDPFANELKRIYKERENRDVPLIGLLKEEGPDGRHIVAINSTECSVVGARVLLLDDLISRATSKVEAVEVLLRGGCIVTHCLVFLDREQGGSKGLQKYGVKLHSIAGLSSVLQVYKDYKLITPEEDREIRSYLQNQQVA